MVLNITEEPTLISNPHISLSELVENVDVPSRRFLQTPELEDMVHALNGSFWGHHKRFFELLFDNSGIPGRVILPKKVTHYPRTEGRIEFNGDVPFRHAGVSIKYQSFDRLSGGHVSYNDVFVNFVQQGGDSYSFFRELAGMHRLLKNLREFFPVDCGEKYFDDFGPMLSFVIRGNSTVMSPIGIDQFCQSMWDRLENGNRLGTNIADILSNLGFTDESVELIISKFGAELGSVQMVAKPSFHPTLVVHTQDGKAQFCKLHYGNPQKARIEQASHYYLPRAGSYYIVSAHIPEPVIGSGVYLTFQDVVPARRQARRDPAYYLAAVAHMHLCGRRAMEAAGVSIPRFDIPEFNELYQQVQFSSQGRSYVDLSMLRDRHEQYEEARRMFEEREGQQVLTHLDLFWKQLMGRFIGDTESLALANDAFPFATWLNDPERPISRGQAMAELRKYHDTYSREIGSFGGFGNLVARVYAATCIRDTISLAWNSINYDPRISPGKLAFVATRF